MEYQSSFYISINLKHSLPYIITLKYLAVLSVIIMNEKKLALVNMNPEHFEKPKQDDDR